MPVTVVWRSRMASASLSRVLFALLFLAVSLPVPAHADQPDVSHPRTFSISSDDAPPVREVIVKFKSDVRAASAQSHSNLGADVVRHSESGRFDVVRVPEGQTVDDVVQYYLASGLVEYAEPNFPRSATWEPNDPWYPLQWHFDHVNAEAAWDIQRGGSSGVIVAVLDTGVAYENYGSFAQAPDLAGTLFVPGYDFVNSDDHPNDDHWHGTHVTGTIAQTTNNGLGVARLAFGVSLMPVKVLNAGGTGTVADVVDGIYFAVGNGADIINMSLSGDSNSSTEAEAIGYANDNGVIVVCAAGNEGPTGPDQYPAAYATTIAVGATGYSETRASYSNTGDYLDIVAPGGDGSYYVWQETFAGVDHLTDFDVWGMQGTSMAAPHVSAAAALLLSMNPDLSHGDVRFILESTAVDLGAPGWDAEYGHGLLDVAAALSFVPKPEPPTSFAATPYEYLGFYRINLSWDAGEGAARTYIVASTEGVPADREDGVLVYDGDGTSCVHSGLAPETTYYYRAWSRFDDDEGEPVWWSDGSEPASATTDDAPDPIDFDITLKSGWNMVSVPLALDSEHSLPSQVFPDIEAIYTWSPDTKSYTVPPVIEPARGYWVAVVAGKTITVTGIPVSAWGSPISAGWTMMGSVHSTEPVAVSSLGEAPPGSILSNAIYKWDPVSKSYTSADTIEEGRGYWLAATQDCDLVMPAP